MDEVVEVVGVDDLHEVLEGEGVAGDEAVVVDVVLAEELLEEGLLVRGHVEVRGGVLVELVGEAVVADVEELEVALALVVGAVSVVSHDEVVDLCVCVDACGGGGGGGGVASGCSGGACVGIGGQGMLIYKVLCLVELLGVRHDGEQEVYLRWGELRDVVDLVVLGMEQVYECVLCDDVLAELVH